MCNVNVSTMVYIANPLYDAVFDFMMDDERVARILLSALLKKNVVAVETKQRNNMNTPV